MGKQESGADTLVTQLLTAADSVFEAGLHAAQPRTIEGPHQYVLVPEGAKVQELGEAHMPSPTRIRTGVSFYAATSFVAYVLRFRTAASLIFADQKSLLLRAVLDYHEPGAATGPAAKWCSHVAALQLRKTDAWEQWTKANGQRMDQVTFAAFLEDHLVDIASPDGATLLETAKNLEVRKSAAFTSAVRLDNGQHQFGYVEDVQGTGQKGTMTIPDRFVLGLAPVEGVEPYRVDARLRYRMQDGKLAIWFDLLRADDYLKAAFESVVAFVKAQTAVEVLLGSVTSGEGR